MATESGWVRQTKHKWGGKVAELLDDARCAVLEMVSRLRSGLLLERSDFSFVLGHPARSLVVSLGIALPRWLRLGILVI
jgi:hypothetical protein